MQVKILYEEEKLKKAIAATLIAGILIMNAAPIFAIEDVKKSTATPKEFKSMAKKNKKVNNDYKYAYVNMDWWKNFNDENLNSYIRRAIENNYDLKMATLTVEEYYQQTRAQFANELPTVTAGFAPNLLKMPGATNTTGMYAVPAIANYEIDLFLKNRDKTKASKKLWEGSQLDERSAYISVASAVGTTYLNIVMLDKIIEIQEEIVKDRKEIYDLMVLSHSEGLASTADTVRANKSYVSGNTNLIDLKKQRETMLHQLCVLIGESPENADTLQRTYLDDLDFTGVIPAEISSDVIIQRPDYMKAEKMVEKAGIDVRVAKKEFLPSISLTGLALFNANDLGSIFSTKGMLAMLGGSIMYPFFTGGSRFANLRIRKAEYERILQNYYKTNLTAIQEVNDSLVSIKMDTDKMTETEKQAKLEKADFGYNTHRYNEGTISKLDLIQFKENLLTMDKLVAQNKVDCLVDYIGLYKAVGSKL